VYCTELLIIAFHLFIYLLTTNFSNLSILCVYIIFYSTCPSIHFVGAIYAKATGNWIGAIEMITATAWCGIFYALIGGQPMVRCV
jgi:hypothetical protein